MPVITINWLDQAACLGKGSDLFFTDPTSHENKKVISKAKTFCKSCPVVAECLQYAINNDERFGVWGSFSAKERSTIKSHLNTDVIDLKQAKQIVNKTLMQVKETFPNVIFVENN